MVLTSKFKITQGKDGIIRLKVYGVPNCPICGRQLNKNGTRKRKFFDKNLKLKIVIIRRLKCPHCNKIHHELPDFIVPYKRHCSANIEHWIDTDASNRTVEAETSTIYRAKKWFVSLKAIFNNLLAKNKVEFSNENSAPFSSLEELRKEKGWLARVVKFIGNSNFWKTTRSAFHVL